MGNSGRSPVIPNCRSSTGHRCLTICHQRPATLPCSPKVAPWGQGGWAASFCAWGGHRLWCPLLPNLRGHWQFCRDTKHQSMCQAITFFAWPHHNTSLVGGSSSSSDVDSLESFRGLSCLGLFGYCFCWMDWTFSPGSNSGSVSLCLPKT